MINKTYIKEVDKDSETVVISFEGDKEDIYRIRDYAEHMHDEPSICCEHKEDLVNRPSHYCSGMLETIEKINSVLDGITGEAAYDLGNVLKYFDRAGLKDDTKQDLAKANNYAHRLITGKWRSE